MRKPDFFIVGAPKCGTTALNDYLQQHPQIFMPLEDYLAFFRDATHEKRVGEASVWYLYSRVAAREIKEFCPCARIIIMLRNPADMLYSLHSQLLSNGNEDIVCFFDALGAEPDRRKGLRVPKLDGDDRFLPRKLEKEVETFMSHTERRIVYSIDAYGQWTEVWVDGDTVPPSGYVFREVFSRDFPGAHFSGTSL